MVAHLGPGIDRTKDKTNSDRQGDGSRAKAGQSLLTHIQQYHEKGFFIKRVTSDGEPSIKAVRSEVERLGVELNILGHGSHTPHAEAGIRHIKNKARSTKLSLAFPLPAKLGAALISFVVHTANMVPKVNAPGHLPAHTAFLGRIPNFTRDAPFAFGTAGFLQRAHHPRYNTATQRGDFCIWLGTTHNLAGTHRCFNLDTLCEMTGDIFRPTMITNAAILRLSTLAGVGPIPLSPILDAEPLLTDPMPPYPLDPHRGVQDDKQMAIQQSESSESDIVMADAVNIDVDPRGQTVDTSHDNDMTYEVESSQNLSVPLHEDALIEVEDDLIEVPDRAISQAEELVDARDTPKYNFRTSTTRKHVYSTLSIKAARNLYGHELADKATRDELITCIEKDVWECLDPSYVVRGAIPSRMFLTPKTLPNGELDRVKGRIVAGGHRQDRTLYEDKEISSPTVALTSVLTMAALAAHERRHVMTLDHKAAYLNAKMLGPPVVMMLPAEVAEMLCNIDFKYSKFLRPDKKIAVKLKKALYGCIQSAVLWYNELTSTLEELGFIRNPYDTCSFSRPHQDS